MRFCLFSCHVVFAFVYSGQSENLVANQGFRTAPFILEICVRVVQSEIA